MHADACAQTQLQEGFYAALRARQAFVDGDHVLCWRAVGMSSRLLRHIVKGAVPAAYSDDVHRALAVLALRQITATRIALYRLRSYYGAVNVRLESCLLSYSLASCLMLTVL